MLTCCAHLCSLSSFTVRSLSSSDRSAAGAERRRLASSSASGIQIKRDDACVTFGAESDVAVQRTGDGTLRLMADSLVLDSHDALQDTEGNKVGGMG